MRALQTREIFFSTFDGITDVFIVSSVQYSDKQRVAGHK